MARTMMGPTGTGPTGKMSVLERALSKKMQPMKNAKPTRASAPKMKKGM
jgi:hypothetical protein